MYCMYCGKKIKNDLTVCKECAKKHNQKTKKNRRRSKVIALVSAAVLLIFVSIFAVICIQRYREKKVTESMNVLLAQEKEQLNPHSVGTQIAEAIYGNTSFDVISAKRNTAKISIHSPDIYSIYMAALQEKCDIVPETKFEYEQLTAALLESVCEELEEGNYMMRTTEIVVQFNDEFEVKLSYELVDALYGGLLSLQEELVASYIEGVSK